MEPPFPPSVTLPPFQRGWRWLGAHHPNSPVAPFLSTGNSQRDPQQLDWLAWGKLPWSCPKEGQRRVRIQSWKSWSPSLAPSCNQPRDLPFFPSSLTTQQIWGSAGKSPVARHHSKSPSYHSGCFWVQRIDPSPDSFGQKEGCWVPLREFKGSSSSGYRLPGSLTVLEEHGPQSGLCPPSPCGFTPRSSGCSAHQGSQGTAAFWKVPIQGSHWPSWVLCQREASLCSAWPGSLVGSASAAVPWEQREAGP